MLKKEIKLKYEITKSELLRNAKQIKGSMETLIARLETRKIPIINSQGEIQQQGLKLDLLCAEFCVYQDLLDRIENNRDQ